MHASYLVFLLLLLSLLLLSLIFLLLLLLLILLTHLPQAGLASFQNQKMLTSANALLLRANQKTCDVCGQVFKIYSALFRHKVLVHGVNKLPKRSETVPTISSSDCAICDDDFNWPDESHLLVCPRKTAKQIIKQNATTNVESVKTFRTENKVMKALEIIPVNSLKPFIKQNATKNVEPIKPIRPENKGMKALEIIPVQSLKPLIKESATKNVKAIRKENKVMKAMDSAGPILITDD